MRAVISTLATSATFLTFSLVAQESTPDPADCDIGRGETQFVMCAICHTNEADAGPGALGPNLYRIIGKPVAADEDFYYTDGMAAYGDTWTMDLLDTFLVSPMTEVPGTSMAFAGIRNDEDRAAVICYLSQ